MLYSYVDDLAGATKSYLESDDFPEPKLTSNNTEELLKSYSKIQIKDKHIVEVKTVLKSPPPIQEINKHKNEEDSLIKYDDLIKCSENIQYPYYADYKKSLYNLEEEVEQEDDISLLSDEEKDNNDKQNVNNNHEDICKGLPLFENLLKFKHEEDVFYPDYSLRFNKVQDKALDDESINNNNISQDNNEKDSSQEIQINNNSECIENNELLHSGLNDSEIEKSEKLSEQSVKEKEESKINDKDNQAKEEEKQLIEDKKDSKNEEIKVEGNKDKETKEDKLIEDIKDSKGEDNSFSKDNFSNEISELNNSQSQSEQINIEQKPQYEDEESYDKEDNSSLNNISNSSFKKPKLQSSILLGSRCDNIEFNKVPPASNIKKPLTVSAFIFCTLFVLFILRNNSS